MTTSTEKTWLLPASITAFALSYAFSPFDLVLDSAPHVGLLDDAFVLIIAGVAVRALLRTPRKSRLIPLRVRG